MPPKQYQRPKNPPRFHSSDAVPQHRSSSPAPPLPHSNLAPTDYSSDRETGGSVGRRSPSPSISSGSSAHRATRKPVPVYNPTDEPPVPAGAPRPNNPNPFAAANALVALRSNEAAASAPTSRPLTPGAGEHRGRTTAHGHDEEDKVSPTSKAHNRRSTSPDGSPDDDDEIATLNFARRPSQFDPLAPSFHPSHGQTSGGQQGARSLLPAGGRQPSQQKGQHQRQRSSHTRHPSISLGVGAGSGSPSSSPLPSPSFNPSFGAQQSAPPAGQDGRKILPLQPAARSGGPHSKNAHSDQRVEGTRAPIEAFASVEMLQGMRQASERSRGTEVFGPGGTYEGRASSISGEAGLPAYSRRTADPLASLHAARNPFAQAQHDHRSGGGAPQLPPIHVGGANAEADVFSIANQLRAHDQLRRGSEDVNSLGYQRRFSSNEEDDLSPPPSAGGVTKLNPHFSFPAMKGGNSSSVSLASSTGGNTGGKTPAPAYPDSMGGLASAFDDDDEGSTRNSRNSHRYPPDLKSFFTFGGSSNNKDSTGGGWRTENLGTSAAGQLSSQSSSSAFAQPRPSIVALPVYPSPGGSVSRSFKTRTKKIATRVCILTGLATIAATWFYLWLRYHAMRTVEGKRPGIFVGGWAFLSLETVVAAMTSIHILWTTLTYRARTADPKMRLRGDANLPSVDVFIVASGQADQTVFDCAVAAASIDYPPHRYRVMVLDAGASDNLQKELARHAKAQACPHLSYHRRELGATGNGREGEKSPKLTVQQRKTQKEDRVSNKANSINFGMMEASSFGIKGPAEYVAVFDADMIPERNYLRAVLPHILTSPKTALVKTRHGFINLPHRLSQAASTLYTAAETPSDTRSGFLLRRAALSDIGGFPADSWIHDGQCEALLLGRGFKVHQVDEVLQWGMAKPTYAAQVNAMMVNRLGPLRTAHRLGWFLGGEKTKLMPFAARAKAVGKALLPIFSVVIIVLAYVYPFMFSFGGILVLTPNLSNLNHLLQATLLMLLLSKLHESLWCWSTGQPSPRRSMQSWIFAAPYQGLALVRLMLPVKFGGFKRGTDLDINEVIAHPEREVWYKRTLRFALDPNVGTVFGFLAALGVAIWRIVKEYEHGTVDEHQTALTVLLTVAWPSLLWLEFVMAAFVPFVCLLFPSRLLTEPRESFLIRDHYSSVARPKHHFKTASPFKVHRAPEFVTGTFVLAWAIVCVCVAKLTDVLA